MAPDETPQDGQVGADPGPDTTMRLSAVDPDAVAAGLTAGAAAEAATQVPAQSATGAPVDTGTLASLQPHTALLRVDHGPNAGSRFLLDADVTTVGRSPSSDIFLDDVTVSRKHAQFTRVADGFVVRDVGSLNGTYVNRERIDEVAVQTGDEVQIGKFRLVVHLSPAQ
jgi:pSer/pThr/pTyr-binding forkhead associated (FHA) protein